MVTEDTEEFLLMMMIGVDLLLVADAFNKKKWWYQSMNWAKEKRLLYWTSLFISQISLPFEFDRQFRLDKTGSFETLPVMFLVLFIKKTKVKKTQWSIFHLNFCVLWSWRPVSTFSFYSSLIDVHHLLCWKETNWLSEILWKHVGEFNDFPTQNHVNHRTDGQIRLMLHVYQWISNVNILSR